MSGRVNGGKTRVQDLEAARRVSRRMRKPTLTADEASILIDNVFLQYGMDPTLWTDLSGWRHIMIGSAEGYAGVVEWQPGDDYLVVLAPLLEIDEETQGLTEFFRMLLELNYHGTLSAHFSIDGDTLYLGITRPIRGLDEEEVEEAIRTVMVLADSYDDRLKELMDIIPPSMPRLPDIKMRPQESQLVGSILSACDSHGQAIFRSLMESWDEMGYKVDASTTGIGLKFAVKDQIVALAALHPGFADRRQEIILAWEGLRRKMELPEATIDGFQASVSLITKPRTTANTAHIEVTDAFSDEDAKALIKSMHDFVLAAQSHLVSRDTTQWDPLLPKMELHLKASTLSKLQDTLKACSPRVQKIYAQLIQGWADAEGEIECLSPGRIYLKFKTGEHEYGKYGVLSHEFNLIVLAAPREEEAPSIDLAWNLASGEHAYLDYAARDVQRFEAVVSEFPGFEQRGPHTRVLIGEAFDEGYARRLLEAMLDLKAAAGE